MPQTPTGLSKARLLQYLQQADPSRTPEQVEADLAAMLSRFQRNFSDIHTTLEKIATKAREAKQVRDAGRDAGA